MRSIFTKRIWQVMSLTCLLFNVLPTVAQVARQFVKASSQYVTVPHNSSMATNSSELAAHHKLDEGSGNKTANATSNGSRGTLVNGPTSAYRTNEPSSTLPFAQLGDKIVGTGLDGAAGQGESVDVSADGNTAIVGGPGDDGGRGAVWFYTKSGGNWQLDGSKIAVESSGFGTSVSISADGTTAVVGSPQDNGGIGAAWIFIRTGGAWVQQGGKLVATDAAGTPNQGQSVSISDDGNRIIVGAPGDHVTGSAWIFVRTGTVWTQFNNRLAIKPAGSRPAEVGYAVAISGDGHTVMVGGRFDAEGVGASWIFKDNGTNETWSLKTKLVGSDAIGLGLQGSTVSLSYDGTTAATGAWADDNGIGAVWGFTLIGTTWAQYGQKTIIPGEEQLQLGWSVALSGDGNTLLAGAPLKQSGETVPGASYTIHKNADFRIGWEIPKDALLVGTGTTGVLSAQGISVSISADGNTAVIGGPQDDSTVGAAWAFGRSGNEWTQQGQKLVGLGAISPTQQGKAVAISADGNTAVVAGPYYDRNRGAIWVYTRSGSSWIQLQQLSGDASIHSSLGVSVAISTDGNTIFTGGSSDDNGKGAVWVFTRSGGVFSQQAKLVAGNASDAGYQGSSVACSADGNTVIFGAPGDNFGTGAAFVYTRTGVTWAQTAKLLGSNSFTEGQEMGNTVSISADGTTAIAGAKTARNTSFGDLPTGAAYVFTLSGNTWAQQARLTGPTTAVLFGLAASISGDGNTVAIGAPDQNKKQGSTWIFIRSGNNWSQQAILLPTGQIGASKTGSSLALTSSGDRLLIGGPQDNSGAGAIWVFDRSGSTWLQKGRLFGTGALGNANQGTSVAISPSGEFAIAGGFADNREYGAAWTFATQTCDQSPTHLYVSSSANGANNGNSWDNAFNTLQDALAAARLCSNIAQIWVAKGTYYPDEGVGYTDNDRFASFKMINNVAIYGGFAGSEPADYNLASRNFTTNETILSGDIDQNDQPNFTNTSGNANHLFFNINSGLTSTAILNGFTVTAGNAINDSGGGFFNSGGSPTVAFCRIIGNQARYGGGLFNGNSAPKISIDNCYIANNVSTSDGGGLYNQSSGVMEITNSQIIQNTATTSFGGGIMSFGGLTLSGSRINANNADNGGGIQQVGSSLTILNSEINNNRTVYQGSAVSVQDCSNATLTNCSITGNASQNSIGGISNSAYAANAVLNLINCTVANNTSQGVYKAITTSVDGDGLTATTNVKNMIVANNPGGNFVLSNGAALQSGGNNLDSDGSSGFLNGTNGDLVNVDPLFVSPTNFTLQTCSPAVNAGSDAANATVTDIAGNARKFGVIDIGAYELQQAKTNQTLPGSGEEIVLTILANQTSAFTESCSLVANLKSSGTHPVTGSVEARVWVETTQPTYNSQPFVRRHYQIAPDQSIASTATGTVTLYFTQADFDSFNDYPGVVSLLPTSPGDATGISHFAMYKYSGRSQDETGLPGSYPQPGVMVAATDVKLTWNDASQWWEATITVSGFSGFFAGSTDNNPLPISDLLDFNVSNNAENGVAIKWKVISDHKIDRFEIEKSYNGKSFTTLQRVPVLAGVTSYVVDDVSLQVGTQYYRLKLFDTDGSVSHSRIKSFQWDAIRFVEAYPNPFGNTLNVSLSAVKAGDVQVSIINVLGQTLSQKTFSLSAGPNTFALEIGNLSGGMYLLHYISGDTSGLLRVVKK